MISGVKSEPATSPVIGTILLVAIAVVLVAIILVVVMGFSGDTNERKIGLNAKAETGSNATLILYGGASIPDLMRLEMIDQDSPMTFLNIVSEEEEIVVSGPVMGLRVNIIDGYNIEIIVIDEITGKPWRDVAGDSASISITLKVDDQIVDMDRITSQSSSLMRIQGSYYGKTVEVEANTTGGYGAKTSFTIDEGIY